MDYSRTDPTTSGNINVIDQSLIQALQGKHKEFLELIFYTV